MNIKRVGLGVGVAFVLLIIVCAVAVTNSSKNAAPVVDKDAAFSDAAKARFANIQTSIPELADIHCLDNTCTNVAYFNFKTLPSDAETIIRGQAATFSTFHIHTYGVGHVTVYAQVAGKNLFHCDAADGKVTECAND